MTFLCMHGNPNPVLNLKCDELQTDKKSHEPLEDITPCFLYYDIIQQYITTKSSYPEIDYSARLRIAHSIVFFNSLPNLRWMYDVIYVSHISHIVTL